MENTQTPKQWADEVIAWMKPIRNWDSTKHRAQKTLMWVNGMAVLANTDSEQECLESLKRVLQEKEKRHPNGLAGDLSMTSNYTATAQWFLPWVWKLQGAKTEEAFQSTWQRCSTVFAHFLSHANSGKHTTVLWKLDSKEDQQYAETWCLVMKTRRLRGMSETITEDEKKKIERAGYVWKGSLEKWVQEEKTTAGLAEGEKEWFSMLREEYASTGMDPKEYVATWNKGLHWVKNRSAYAVPRPQDVLFSKPLFALAMLASVHEQPTSLVAGDARPLSLASSAERKQTLREWAANTAFDIAKFWDKTHPNSEVAHAAINHVAVVWPLQFLERKERFKTAVKWSHAAKESLSKWVDHPVFWEFINSEGGSFLPELLRVDHYAIRFYSETLGPEREMLGGAATRIQEAVWGLKDGVSNTVINLFRQPKSGILSSISSPVKIPEDEWERLLLKWSKTTGSQYEESAVLGQSTWFSWCAECVEKKDTKALKILCEWQPDWASDHWVRANEPMPLADDMEQEVIRKIGKCVDTSNKCLDRAFERMSSGAEGWQGAWRDVSSGTKLKVRAILEQRALTKKHGSLTKTVQNIKPGAL